MSKLHSFNESERNVYEPARCMVNHGPEVPQCLKCGHCGWVRWADRDKPCTGKKEDKCVS